MKTVKCVMVVFLVIGLAIPMLAIAGNGFMGGRGQIVVDEEPAADEGGIPDSVEGPLNDKMADQGKLFGDLYKILRYQGGETKLAPEVDAEGNAVYNGENGEQLLVEAGSAVGGEPVLSEAYAQYALEASEGAYELSMAPHPSQCVQPVADYGKWGDIKDATGLENNRLPMVMSYDSTWKRTECEVNELLGITIDTSTGVLTYDINEYFIPACSDEDISNGDLLACTWNGVAYCNGVLWVDLVDEVHFGRLNLSRSPEATLQAAFDEAISAINNATSISRDAAGRLLLTTTIFDEFMTLDGETCTLMELETRTKAIDSPLENLALYVKLMRDGHLVTPGDERAPIDRSENGGIPLWKMLELSDGPSDALRPTVTISQLSGFPNLVNVDPVNYYTYYECYNSEGGAVPCLCEGTNPDGEPTVVACENVVSRKLLAVDSCPDLADNPNAASCEGPWNGIKSDDGDDLDELNDYEADGADFDFAAAFLAAAADKTGEIGMDMLVYVNSIMGINMVVGYSAYDEDGNPAEDAVDYSKYPDYFNFENVPGYNRGNTIGGRGDGGYVTVLREDGVVQGAWSETPVEMMNGISFDNLGLNANGFPDGTNSASSNILGFTQMADDNLSIIKFVHTYQIPGLR